jgi:hypothetical protein
MRRQLAKANSLRRGITIAALKPKIIRPLRTLGEKQDLMALANRTKSALDIGPNRRITDYISGHSSSVGQSYRYIRAVIRQHLMIWL